MRVLLHDNQLCERGTTTSMMDYARVLRTAGHDVEISYWKESHANVPAIISLIGEEFRLLPHSNRFEVPKEASSFDAAYFIKAGGDDGLIAPGVHTLVHVVFQQYEPHGSRYAYISQWLADSMRDQVMDRNGRELGLPLLGATAKAAGCENALDFTALELIVNIAIPEVGVRSQLGIPEEAFVILRFGGIDTFDLVWAQETVVRLLEENRDWYFIGLNTEQFTEHPRARFIPMVMDPVEKASVIAASDVFLTARGQGEAFGVAIVEALQIGIPVLAWKGGTDRNHVHLLAGLGGLFNKPWDLRMKLRRIAKGKDPASVKARKERGDRYRPNVVAPELEALLNANS
jgi:glycosyltransferase involved in cell wall biosynthesis